MRFDADKFDEMIEKKEKGSVRKKVVSWMTGQRS